jgi:hypothetical protein
MKIEALMTVENQNWCRRFAGPDLSLTATTNSATTEGVGKLSMTTFHSKYKKKFRNLSFWVPPLKREILDHVVTYIHSLRNTTHDLEFKYWYRSFLARVRSLDP